MEQITAGPRDEVGLRSVLWNPTGRSLNGPPRGGMLGSLCRTAKSSSSREGGLNKKVSLPREGKCCLTTHGCLELCSLQQCFTYVISFKC